MNGSGYFWVETQLKSLSLWSWPQVYRQVCRQTVTESERETPEWSQSPEPTLKTLTESSRPEHEHDRLQPCSQSHRKCVSETGRQWDRQAVSETANSSRVNIWFQSTATNKKCCVFISVWLQLSLTPPTVATAGCGSALSDLHHSLPSVFLRYVASVCVNIWSPSSSWTAELMCFYLSVNPAVSQTLYVTHTSWPASSTCCFNLPAWGGGRHPPQFNWYHRLGVFN